MNYLRNSWILFVAGALVLGTACDSETGTPGHAEADEPGAHDDHGEHGEGEIRLTRQQMDAVGIGFGQLSSLNVDSYIEATGTLDLPPGSQAVVSAPAAGFLRQAKEYVEGDYVKKGTLLAQLENPEFIALQQHYLEALAELTFLRAELVRQRALAVENAGVERELQQAASRVAMMEATLAGQRAQLEFLGIDPARLDPDNIVRRVAVRAPRSGYLATISIREGLYVNSQQVLAELIDDDHFHLELAVFEADVAKLKVGQPILYTVPSLGDARYRAEVHVIGKEFDRETKTVRVHGHIEGTHPPFIRDLFTEAKILLDTSATTAVTEEAIVRNGQQDYVYITTDASYSTADEVSFVAVPVVVGRRDGALAEVKLLSPMPSGAQLVTKGAYYLYAQSMAGEVAHEH